MNSQEMMARSSLCLLAWFSLAVAPTFAQTITHAPLTFDGSSAVQGQNASVSGAGDVNGDGFDDFIVGAPIDIDRTDFDVFVANLIAGLPAELDNEPFSGNARVLSGSDGSVLYSFDGDSDGDRFGWSVSGAGDVNGDGFADLIVGAPRDANNGDSSGSARVFSGSDGSVLYNFDGDDAHDEFGFSVSGAGDVNGDGFADLIVGARGDAIGGSDVNLFGGSARVFSGVDGSVLYNFEGDFNFVQFGFSVSGAGDVNGDGFADMIVGATYDANGTIVGGSAQVFSGVDGSVIHKFFGDRGTEFGRSVSGAGDVNGDGFADLIVSSQRAPNLVNIGFIGNNGSAQVFSGFDGSTLYEFGLEFRGDGNGYSVSGAGDVNGDGFADLLVGGRLDDNNVSGNAGVFSGFDGSVLYNFEGDSADDRFGSSVSGAGDVNGDGLADFVVGTFTGEYTRLFVSQTTASTVTPVMLGDCNQDEVVDFTDIPMFIEALATSSYLEEADINQDVEVNLFDISPFIGILAGN